MLTLQLIENSLQSLDGFYLWKDTDSEYLGISPQFARLLGYQTSKQIIGARDESLAWAEFAEQAVHDDQIALHQGGFQGIEYARFSHQSEMIPFLVSKHRFSDGSGVHQGIFAQATPLEEVTFPTLKQRQLSQREQQCLQLFLQGKTCREIGDVLCLSHRTTEKYLASLKLKFNVGNKAALVSKAIQEGYLTNVTDTIN